MSGNREDENRGSFISRSGSGKRPLLGGMFSKRKPINAHDLQLLKKSSQSASKELSMSLLQSIFPSWEISTLQLMLEDRGFIVEHTISAILAMEEEEEKSRLSSAKIGQYTVAPYAIKTPLPDDFLRLPDGYTPSDMDISETSGITELSGGDIEPYDDDDDDDCDQMDANGNATINQEHAKSQSISRHDESLAEDDGTIYGREIRDDEDIHSPPEDPVPPPPVLTSSQLNSELVKDSMNQKFLPEVFRNSSNSSVSPEKRFSEEKKPVIDRKCNEQSDVNDVGENHEVLVAGGDISDSVSVKDHTMLKDESQDQAETLKNKKSISILDKPSNIIVKSRRLNLTEAEKRIRHREPHRVFELLSKTSELYRNGVLDSREFETLRSMVVAKIQPAKLLLDTTMQLDGIISDHDWHLLQLKAKNIRHALSIRIIGNDYAFKYSHSKSSHTEYLVRVVDLSTGVVWFTKKRFRELHRLHRKLCKLSSRVSETNFPTRRYLAVSSSSTSQSSLARYRAPLVEDFLRVAATLVTPSPLTFLHGCALKQLQEFLDTPTDDVLERNRTRPIARALRVFVYHTINDPTSPEGKSCAKFLNKIRLELSMAGRDHYYDEQTIQQQPSRLSSTYNSDFSTSVKLDLLDEVGDIIDGIQEYMLEHRFEEMRTQVTRMLIATESEQNPTAPSTSMSKSGNSAIISDGGITTALKKSNYARKPRPRSLQRSFTSTSSANDDALANNDAIQQLISESIRQELEERICAPLMNELTNYVATRVQSTEILFRKRVAQLKGKPQSYFGIPIDKISLSSWQMVIKSIKEMDDAFLPLDKMKKLVATALAVHSLHKMECQLQISGKSEPTLTKRLENLTIKVKKIDDIDHTRISESCSECDSSNSFEENEEQENVLSGSDFLPIFIYVIVNSDLAAPVRTQVLLNKLCDPEKRRSESGYYLATFEAAIHHILSSDINHDQ